MALLSNVVVTANVKVKPVKDSINLFNENKGCLGQFNFKVILGDRI